MDDISITQYVLETNIIRNNCKNINVDKKTEISEF